LSLCFGDKMSIIDKKKLEETTKKRAWEIQRRVKKAGVFKHGLPKSSGKTYEPKDGKLEVVKPEPKGGLRVENGKFKTVRPNLPKDKLIPTEEKALNPKVLAGELNAYDQKTLNEIRNILIDVLNSPCRAKAYKDEDLTEILQFSDRVKILMKLCTVWKIETELGCIGIQIEELSLEDLNKYDLWDFLNKKEGMAVKNARIMNLSKIEIGTNITV
jgi:hypothetical protein